MIGIVLVVPSYKLLKKSSLAYRPIKRALWYLHVSRTIKEIPRLKQVRTRKAIRCIVSNLER